MTLRVDTMACDGNRPADSQPMAGNQPARRPVIGDAGWLRIPAGAWPAPRDAVRGDPS
jgi:hypothetical protein